MPSSYKLTITKTDPAPTDNPSAWKDDTIYTHHLADEAAAKRIVHELTRPQRKPRVAKSKPATAAK